MSDKPTDPAILKARELFEASGKTMDEVGLAMGFKPDVARKSVWQLLNKIDDPKLSTLRKFATAMGIPLTEFFLPKKRAGQNDEAIDMDADNATGTPKIREGRLMEFLHRNLFRVRLYNGVEIVAMMPDELLPSFDPNIQLTMYNRPYIDVEIREAPQSPKILAIRPTCWIGGISRKFWEYEV